MVDVIRLTAVAIPVKVILRIAMALVVQAILFAGGAVCERNVVIGNVVKEMDFILLEHQTGCNGVNRSIAPSLVEEATGVIERSKEVDVCIGA